MKNAPTYLIAALLMFALAGCKQGKTDYEQLTDSEKLEVLDLRIERQPKDDEALAERAAPPTEKSATL